MLTTKPQRVAADLMTPNPVSIRESAPVEEAIAFLTDSGFSAAPVIDEAGRPVGVISRTDLVVHERERIAAPAGAGVAEDRVGRPDGATVRDLMTPALFAVSPRASAADVVDQMVSLNVHRLFVVDESGVLVGVISALDLLRQLRP